MPERPVRPSGAGWDGKTGNAMVSHLMGLGDVFADRPNVALALTEEAIRSARGVTSKAIRGNISLMLGMLMLATRGLSAANLANPWLNVIPVRPSPARPDRSRSCTPVTLGPPARRTCPP
jgi:hypothetical protein